MELPEKVVFEGRTEYHLNGQLHREDGPARIYNDGTEVWYLHGRRHREDGPAVIWKDGDKWWFRHGQWHREDGPAVIWKDGEEWWYLHGKIHREDGPAVIRKSGTNWWYIEGKELTKEDTKTAKQILSGKYPFENLPLLINHPTLNYFARKAFQAGYPLVPTPLKGNNHEVPVPQTKPTMEKA